MVIYGEYLFLENCITGWVILYFTAKISGEGISVARLAAGGIGCGLYAFTMFWTWPGAPWLAGILSGISKVGFAFLMIVLVFGRKTGCWRNVLLFFLVTFLYGGVTIGLLTFFGWQGAWDLAGAYLPGGTYLTVMAAGTAGALCLWFGATLIEGRRVERRLTVEVTVFLEEKQWSLQGIIDSGNFLQDPLSGKAVALVGEEMMEKLLQGCESRERRFVPVPYRTIDRERGILSGYRFDAMKAGEIYIAKPILASCETGAFLAGGRGEQILLPLRLVERGIDVEAK